MSRLPPFFQPSFASSFSKTAILDLVSGSALRTDVSAPMRRGFICDHAAAPVSAPLTDTNPTIAWRRFTNASRENYTPLDAPLLDCVAGDAVDCLGRLALAALVGMRAARMEGAA